MNKKILKLSIPNIISNITVPLLGMADLAIAGRLGDFTYIGAIGIGAAIFNLIYWNFGFLRFGTSGFTAQAYGARDLGECGSSFIRGGVIALGIALLILLAQYPLSRASLYILNAEGETKSLALQYFSVRIWAAPATLMMYVCNGWFIGMQNSKIPMTVAITMNLINIGCSALFALGFKMGIAGVALGTLISQYSGVAMSMFFINRHYRKVFRLIKREAIFTASIMRRFFVVNSDIFLRTVCLAVVFTFFTSASSAMGEDILAVNTLLIQLFTLFSYFMDGFAHAGEALVGRYTGAKNEQLLRKAISRLILWGVYMSIPFTLLYAFGLEQVLSLFTDEKEVLSKSLEFRYWITAVPIVSFLAFLYDGILVGATQSAVMRNAMFVATSLFFVVYFALKPLFFADALWIALLVYLLLRGVVQILMFKVKKAIE
ncbi:MAG: MATE family efflux transporter [Rikenellaceae bacterium]